MSSKKVSINDPKIPERKSTSNNRHILEAEKIAIDGLKDILQITVNALSEKKP